MHFTCVSGARRETFSISFHKAANATMCASALLTRQREAAHSSEILRFKNI